MATYYFTFGDNEKHPITGELMRDYWIEVSSSSLTLAKKKMNEEYGGLWQNVFHESVFPSIQRRHGYVNGQFAKYEADGNVN